MAEISTARDIRRTNIEVHARRRRLPSTALATHDRIPLTSPTQTLPEPELGLVVETDSLTYHRPPAKQPADARRDQEYVAAGRIPVRCTHLQIAHEPDEVERVLRAVRSRRSTRR